MPSIEKWREEAETAALYRLKEGDGSLKTFTEYGTGNRITTTDQASMICKLREINAALGDDWNWMGEMADRVEDYQLTVGKPINSRTQLLEAVVFKQMAAHEKSRLIGIAPGGTDGAK